MNYKEKINSLESRLASLEDGKNEVDLKQKINFLERRVMILEDEKKKVDEHLENLEKSFNNSEATSAQNVNETLERVQEELTTSLTRYASKEDLEIWKRETNETLTLMTQEFEELVGNFSYWKNRLFFKDQHCILHIALLLYCVGIFLFLSTCIVVAKY